MLLQKNKKRYTFQNLPFFLSQLTAEYNDN